jgi:hypothetical protein
MEKEIKVEKLIFHADNCKFEQVCIIGETSLAVRLKNSGKLVRRHTFDEIYCATFAEAKEFVEGRLQQTIQDNQRRVDFYTESLRKVKNFTQWEGTMMKYF